MTIHIYRIDLTLFFLAILTILMKDILVMGSRVECRRVHTCKYKYYKKTYVMLAVGAMPWVRGLKISYVSTMFRLTFVFILILVVGAISWITDLKKACASAFFSQTIGGGGG